MHALKPLKALKAQKSTKSTKSTKRHKDTQAKAQNSNKRISDYFPFKFIKEHKNATFLFLSAYMLFVLVVPVKSFRKKEIIKKLKIALMTSFALLLCAEK